MSENLLREVVDFLVSVEPDAVIGHRGVQQVLVYDWTVLVAVGEELGDHLSVGTPLHVQAPTGRNRLEMIHFWGVRAG